jgi:hypothetical protein
MINSFFVLFFALLSLPVNAFAAQKVESRISDIQTYNSQASALSFQQLCEAFQKKTLDLGKKASVSCQNLGDGVVAVTAASTDGLKASLLANLADKLVIEYRGSDEVHSYVNNLNQSIVIALSFVNTGVSRSPMGTRVNGFYRGDIRINNAEGRFRFGYYFNQKLND